MQNIYTIFCIIFLGTINIKCEWVDHPIGCDVEVHGTVQDIQGNKISGAQVSINDLNICCATKDQPCQYISNNEGNWNLKYKDTKDDKNCSITVSKEGYITKTHEYQYSCNERGATVPVDVTVILEEEPQN